MITLLGNHQGLIFPINHDCHKRAHPILRHDRPYKSGRYHTNHIVLYHSSETQSGLNGVTIIFPH